MAKEKPTDPSAKKEKKDKKDKSEKRSSKDGVHKSSRSSKSKPDKTEPALKAAEEAADIDVTAKILNTLEETKPGSVAIKEDDAIEVKVKAAPLLGALVPFANPLADEKVGKKVLKSVKKAAKHKSLKRGVKEVVKCLRKSPAATASSTSSRPHGIVVLAADISPMDVISHIPVLCEDHGVPYIFVPSRAELGAAGSTKRPTSVVMVGRDKAGKKKGGEEEEKKEGGQEEWGEVYGELVKAVEKAGRSVRI